MLDFASVLHPVSVAAFLAEHWERKPLYIARKNPDFFAGLVSLEDVDFLLSTHTGTPGFALSLIGWKTGKYQESPRKPGPLGLDVEKVYDLFRQGATIRIGHLGKYLAPVQRLIGSFEAVLNTQIGVNLYLTPGGSNAFGAHFDNHDVYILQVEGQKHWTLYEPPADLPVEVVVPGRTELFSEPLPYQTRLSTRPPVASTTEIVLEAGDLLYVPRGFVHEVHTGDTLSLHLTVAAPVITWYEVLLKALPEVFADNRLLRQGLPPLFATDPGVRGRAEELAREVAASLDGALTAERLSQAVSELATRFVHSRRPGRPGLALDVSRAEAITMRSVLRIPPGLIHTVRTFRSDLFLLFAGTSVKLPIRAESMIRHICERRQITVGELPTAMSDQSRLLLAQTLVQRGFLEIVDLGGEPAAP